MRYSEVDALKGLGIIGVVIAHVNFPSRLTPTTMLLIHNLQLIFGWCVISFFFASGILIKHTIKTFPEAYGVIKKKFVRLVIPCFIFSLSYKCLLSGIYLTGLFSWNSPIPSSLIETMKFIFYPVGPQFYFLHYLFLISTAVTLLRLLISKNILLLFSIFLLPASYFFFEMPKFGYGPNYSLLPLYFFSYIIGFTLSINNKKIKPMFYLIVLVPIFFTFLITDSLIPCYILIPVTLLLFFQKSPNLTNILNKTNIGRYSPSIYVWHAPIVLPFTSIICVKIIGGQPIVLIPIIFLTIFICIILNLITFKFKIFKFWQF